MIYVFSHDFIRRNFQNSSGVLVIELKISVIGGSPLISSFPFHELNVDVEENPENEGGLEMVGGTESAPSEASSATPTAIPSPTIQKCRQAPIIPKEPLPDITIHDYAWVHPEVGVYHSNFRPRGSIKDFRKSIFISKTRSEDQFIRSPCSNFEHVFLRAKPVEAHFTYM